MVKQFLAIIALTSILFACSDEDSKLEGKWQMTQMEVNGSVMPIDTIYYNFQNSLFMYQIYNAVMGGYQAYGYKKVEDKDKLVLEMDSKTNLTEFYRRSDWTSNTRIFAIEKLSGSKLILQEGGKKYIFRKF
ncbi:lipocalin-like domain-containing protein [Parabacteroides pacaensis]|uniref:lipocalin-like domain-containing protein n=1 Tax=Parabacteroides pacaensis TaxID=2086575 RepID=UPI000D11282E|nr:lipocalin-like domain-containing protein [Parabacteroides pacaensis]